jgi:hypothetical protein
LLLSLKVGFRANFQSLHNLLDTLVNLTEMERVLSVTIVVGMVMRI